MSIDLTYVHTFAIMHSTILCISGGSQTLFDTRLHTFIAHQSYCHAGSYVHLFMVVVEKLQGITLTIAKVV